MMARNKWNDIQRHHVNILFRHYPILRQAYELAMELRATSLLYTSDAADD